MRRILICGLLQAIALAQPLRVNSESCLIEFFADQSGRANLYARAYNKWILFIKEEAPGPSPAAQARYREDLWKLTKDMEKQLDRLQSSRCYPSQR